ncbi:MAG: hypothetical protein IKT98_02120 [Selenomonadaceae bacterium]|nr:hypothetical protein [Selenomonadaceae bacterium]
MIKFIGYYKEWPETNGHYVLTILCPDYVVKEINDLIKDSVFYIQNTGPTEGKIYFNSVRARNFFAEYLENQFFMTFCSYEGRPDNCEICTLNRCYCKYKVTENGKTIRFRVCPDCDRKEIKDAFIQKKFAELENKK